MSRRTHLCHLALVEFGEPVPLVGQGSLLALRSIIFNLTLPDHPPRQERGTDLDVDGLGGPGSPVETGNDSIGINTLFDQPVLIEVVALDVVARLPRERARARGTGAEDARGQRVGCGCRGGGGVRVEAPVEPVLVIRACSPVAEVRESGWRAWGQERARVRAYHVFDPTSRLSPLKPGAMSARYVSWIWWRGEYDEALEGRRWRGGGGRVSRVAVDGRSENGEDGSEGRSAGERERMPSG